MAQVVPNSGKAASTDGTSDRTVLKAKPVPDADRAELRKSVMKRTARIRARLASD